METVLVELKVTHERRERKKKGFGSGKKILGKEEEDLWSMKIGSFDQGICIKLFVRGIAVWSEIFFHL